MSASPVPLATLNRALDVLEAFSEERVEWGLSELSRELGVGKPTLHRVLRNLEHRGYLRQDPVSKRYRLGYAALRISQVAIAATPIDAANPRLRELARSVGEQTTLWVLDVDHAVCVAKISGRHALRTHTDLGAREPVFFIASGRCLVADHDEGALVGLPGYARFHGNLEGIREQGYEISRGDRWPDVGAVAAPIRDHRQRIVAAVAVSAALSRFDEHQFQAIAIAVRDAAADISRELGAV